MKFKFTFIYIAAGAAFVAVSLWVLFSGGKSARAIKAKYRLGGIMLTAWSMLSAASCEGPGPFVTCYEPALPPEVMCYDVAAPADEITVKIKGKDALDVAAGDIIQITVDHPNFKQYVCTISSQSSESVPLLRESFEAYSDGAMNFEVTVQPSGYKGDARLDVYGIIDEGEGKTSEVLLFGPLVIKYI